MGSSISFPSHPRGYYSNITAFNQLPTHLEDHLKTLLSELQHIHTLTQDSHPNPDTLTHHFQQFESKISQFFTELDHSSNRGFESTVKQQFYSAYNLFLDNLKDITDRQGNSLRDALLDPQKLTQCLQQLDSHSVKHIGTFVQTFSAHLSSTFNINQKNSF